MYCPKCGHEQNDGNLECARCGLVFSRYKKIDYSSVTKPGPGRRTLNYLLYTKDRIRVTGFAGRLALFTFLVFWSFIFMVHTIESNYAGKSFMHSVNLPFHETGHIVFMFFGSVMHSLGGSLGQVIMPLICMLVLLAKTRDTFGASVALWWMGESILDTAPYINDARIMQLQLLGGNTGASAPYGFHDWNFILTELGLLKHSHLIAVMVDTSGKAVMAISLVWTAAVLSKQLKKLKSN
ncbi:MAG: zinc ribbon domain-containing protein [Candidatus Fermentibacteraceae bacterium]|nr:zinc ribbon domain-containing protein [Candidatus Fermentibacteraceae bacterium]